MQKKIITLRSVAFNDGIALELPGDQPISTLIPEILKTLHWPAKADNQELAYTLSFENQELNQNLSLDQIGIENFQTVFITPPRLKAAATAELREQDITSLVRGPLPFWESIPVSKPSLISMKGAVFPLKEPTTVIGRHDETNTVDIDLTDLEKYLFISSRRHAEIIKTDMGYMLKPLKATNGTFLNGVEVNPGESYYLQNGNIIQFGIWGVQLVFKMPTPKV